nr:uncharacterized protein LOC109153162 isoform X2 [Ipomoea batatas]
MPTWSFAKLFAGVALCCLTSPVAILPIDADREKGEAKTSKQLGLKDLIGIGIKDKNADLSSKIEQGFGANGLGLLSISDVHEYSLLRKNLLHLSTRYSFGWSYGKEKQDGKLGKMD